MKTYKIKEFAKNLGVTEKTLRHYEKFKIVEPSVDQWNGYRSYNFRDAERILASKRFSNMEFSVKETSQLLSESSIEEMIESFQKQSKKLEQEAKRLKLIAARMKALEEELKWFKNSPNQGFIHQGNEWWFIRHVRNTEFVQDEESLKIVREMMDALPCSVKMLPLPELEERDSDTVWGLAIEPYYAGCLGISFRPPMIRIPAGLYYYYPAVFSGRKERILRGGQDIPAACCRIREELEGRGFRAAGSGYMIGSFDSFSGSQREKHFLFCIPVRG